MKEFELRRDPEFGDVLGCDCCGSECPTVETQRGAGSVPDPCLCCWVCYNTHLGDQFLYGYPGCITLEKIAQGIAVVGNEIFRRLSQQASPQLIELHDFEDGEPIAIDFRDVKLIQPLAAYEGDDETDPLPPRVRIDTSRQTLLVRETWEEIKALTAQVNQ